jgi:YVTN family beta-propeller protein
MGFRKYIRSSLLLTAWAATLTTASAATLFSVQQRWKIGGEGGWDHLTADPAYHRLYVTRSDRVTVVDTGTGEPLAEIAGSGNLHSVCLDRKGKYGYITDGASNAVRVFERATLRIVASLATGMNPDGAVFDAVSQSVFVFNDRSRSATVIDASSNTVASTIQLPGKPAGAAADEHGSLFVALQDRGRIARLDTRARALAASWPVEGCVGPNGVAIDKERERIYTVCENNELAMLDSSKGNLLTALKLSEGAREVVFDPQRNLIFAVNAAGTLTVAREASPRQLAILQTVKTQAGARTLALDSVTQRIYLATAQFGLRTRETSEELLFRPTPVPATFVVLVVGD